MVVSAVIVIEIGLKKPRLAPTQQMKHPFGSGTAYRVTVEPAGYCPPEGVIVPGPFARVVSVYRVTGAGAGGGVAIGSGAGGAGCATGGGGAAMGCGTGTGCAG